MKDFKNKIVKGFAWQASTKLILQLFSWGSTIWVARLLTPEDYGLVGMSGMVTSIFLLLATNGIASGIVNRIDINKVELDTMFWVSTFTGLVLYALLWSVSSPVALFFEDKKLEVLVQVAGLIVVISSLKVVPNTLALRNLDYKLISVTAMIGGFIGIVCTLVLALKGYAYWSLVAGTLVSEIATTAIYFYFSKFVPQITFSISAVTDILRFGTTLLGSRVLFSVGSNIPIFLLSVFSTTTITGHYQMALTLGSMPTKKVGTLFSNLIFPAMSRVQENEELAKKTFLQMHTTLLFVTGPLFFGLALVSEPLIEVALTEAWNPIRFPFQIICLISLFGLSSIFITRALEGLGRASVTLTYQALFILVCGSSMLFGIVYNGLNGMLIAWVVSAPVVYAYLLSRISRTLNIRMREILRTFLPVAICLLSLAATVYAVLTYLIPSSGGGVKLIVAPVTGAVAFSLSAFIFAREYVNDIVNIVFKKVNLENKVKAVNLTKEIK